MIGEEAPSFTLPDLSGSYRSLESFRGQAVLVNFWASWCPPCQMEMPSLNRLYLTLKERGFIVLAVSVDEEGWEPVRIFLKKVPVDFPILLDQMGAVSELYGNYQLPESLLIDAGGRVVERFLGARDWLDPVIVKKIEAFIHHAP